MHTRREQHIIRRSALSVESSRSIIRMAHTNKKRKVSRRDTMEQTLRCCYNLFGIIHTIGRFEETPSIGQFRTCTIAYWLLSDTLILTSV
eukprot:11021326-Karenia_brevis.AAC.1